MTRKFECHLTFHIEHATKVKELGEFFGFSFSQIEGDALLGAKPYCYLSAYAPELPPLQAHISGMRAVLSAEGVECLRTKIEEILFDTKTGLDNTQAA